MNYLFKKTVLIILLSLILSVGNVCSEQGPEMYISKTVYEFGTVFEGDKVVKEFELTNKGDALLVIQRIVPACGCTATSLSKNKIKPGETSILKVQFNTQGFSGSKVKSVKLYINDPKKPTVVLTLKGAIQKNVNVNPSRLEFLDLVEGEDYSNYSKKVSIAARSGTSVKVRDIISLSEGIIVKKIKTSKGYDLEVSISNSITEGELRERIVVQLNGAKYKAINIPVYVKIKPKFDFLPKTLSFGVLEKGQIYKKGVRLINHNNEKVNLTILSKLPNGVKVNIVKLDKQNSMVSVSLNPDIIIKDLKTVIRVKLTSIDPKVKIDKELAFNVFAFSK